MYIYALKMLFGDRVKYTGLIVGIAFSTMLICQQASILSGLIIKTSAFIDEFGAYNVWVVNPGTRFTEDGFAIGSNVLWEVKSIDGVKVAKGVFKRPVQLKNGGRYQSGILIGVTDDGVQPHRIPQDLLERGLVVETKPLKIKLGDQVFVENTQLMVAGNYAAQARFFWEPVFYTSHDNIKASFGIDGFTYIALSADEPDRIAREITEKTGLLGLTADQFRSMNSGYVMRETGIVTNFAIAVALGFVIGIIVTGQTFYNFTLDNLRYYGAMKAMGVDHRTLAGMVIIQALTAALLGFAIGLGCAKACGVLILKMGLAFDLNGLIASTCLVAILSVSLLAAMLSLWRVFRVDPAIVFKG